MKDAPPAAHGAGPARRRHGFLGPGCVDQRGALPARIRHSAAGVSAAGWCGTA